MPKKVGKYNTIINRWAKEGFELFKAVAPGSNQGDFAAYLGIKEPTLTDFLLGKVAYGKYAEHIANGYMRLKLESEPEQRPIKQTEVNVDYKAMYEEVKKDKDRLMAIIEKMYGCSCPTQPTKRSAPGG